MRLCVCVIFLVWWCGTAAAAVALVATLPLPVTYDKVGVAALGDRVFFAGTSTDRTRIDVLRANASGFFWLAPVNLSFSAFNATATTPAYHLSGFTVDGRFVVFTSQGATLFYGDVVTDTWIRAPYKFGVSDIPTSIDDCAISWGDIGNSYSALVVSNFSTSTVTVYRNMTVGGPVRSAAAADPLVFVGLSSGNISVLNWRTLTWQPTLTAAVRRSEYALIAHRGLLFMAGGSNSLGTAQYSTVEIYDIAAQTWLPSYPKGLVIGRARVHAIASGDYVFFAGGAIGNGFSYVHCIDIFDVRARAWLPPMGCNTSLAYAYKDDYAVAAAGRYVYAATPNEVIVLDTEAVAAPVAAAPSPPRAAAVPTPARAVSPPPPRTTPQPVELTSGAAAALPAALALALLSMCC